MSFAACEGACASHFPGVGRERSAVTIRADQVIGALRVASDAAENSGSDATSSLRSGDSSRIDSTASIRKHDACLGAAQRLLQSRRRVVQPSRARPFSPRSAHVQAREVDREAPGDAAASGADPAPRAPQPRSA
jgi:hypothetical protein